MPLLDVSASYDEAQQSGAVFIVNRSQSEGLPVELHWQDRAPKSISAVYQLSGTDPKAFNTFENPNNIVAKSVAAPKLDGQSTMLKLPPLSFTALEVKP
jgi:alpha-N-arabinofuranosidase